MMHKKWNYFKNWMQVRFGVVRAWVRQTEKTEEVQPIHKADELGFVLETKAEASEVQVAEEKWEEILISDINDYLPEIELLVNSVPRNQETVGNETLLTEEQMAWFSRKYVTNEGKMLECVRKAVEKELNERRAVERKRKEALFRNGLGVSIKVNAKPEPRTANENDLRDKEDLQTVLGARSEALEILKEKEAEKPKVKKKETGIKPSKPKTVSTNSVRNSKAKNKLIFEEACIKAKQRRLEIKKRYLLMGPKKDKSVTIKPLYKDIAQEYLYSAWDGNRLLFASEEVFEVLKGLDLYINDVIATYKN